MSNTNPNTLFQFFVFEWGRQTEEYGFLKCILNGEIKFY